MDELQIDLRDFLRARIEEERQIFADFDNPGTIEAVTRHFDSQIELLELHPYEMRHEWGDSLNYDDGVNIPFCEGCAQGADCGHCAPRGEPEFRHCAIHKAMVKVYVDHPDFRKEWLE